MDDLGYPPDSERLRVGFAHAMELIADGTARAAMVTVVLNNRKVKIWAAGEDDLRQKMEGVIRHVLYSPIWGDEETPVGETPVGRDAAADG